jgi:murein DD-endopeptidase MepM/ murein hydrolase activator NlpD
MLPILVEFARRSARVQTVIIMDVDQMEPPRQFQVKPSRFLLLLGGACCGLALLLAGLILFTPLREVVPGHGAEMRHAARLNTLRLQAMQDSLDVQRQYLEHLQQLVTGQLDSLDGAGVSPPAPPGVAGGDAPVGPVASLSPDWSHHEQPAVPMIRFATERSGSVRLASVEQYVSSLKLPALPPVGGFVTRAFDARDGHFAVDIAVEEGSVVRSVGDGYVILADWTQEGGDAMVVQHADGFVSVYKHNQRLLKRVGDRVRDREAIAMSGNSGEVTTGPHVHFELWQDGLAQDPRDYVLGW